MRVAAYLALTVGLLTTSVAGAAPGHACPMVTSPAGGRAYLDVKSADVASGGKNVTAVLRLTSTETAGDPLALLAVKWRIVVQINNLYYRFEVTRRTDAFGKTTDTAALDLAGEPGVVDKLTIDKTSIKWEANRKQFKVLGSPGKVFQSMTASTTWNGGNSDSASAVFKYVDRAKGCIPSA